MRLCTHNHNIYLPRTGQLMFDTTVKPLVILIIFRVVNNGVDQWWSPNLQFPDDRIQMRRLIRATTTNMR